MLLGFYPSRSALGKTSDRMIHFSFHLTYSAAQQNRNTHQWHCFQCSRASYNARSLVPSQHEPGHPTTYSTLQYTNYSYSPRWSTPSHGKDLLWETSKAPPNGDDSCISVESEPCELPTFVRVVLQ